MGTQKMGARSAIGGNSGNPLARQHSVYSLTLDEVETHLGDLGKPLSSMNLDELLKSVWTAESSQSMPVEVQNSASPSQPRIQRQPSLPITDPLSKKTVDEVWRDIQQGQNGNTEKATSGKQPTLGEMTLEDFLIKAGVVADGVLEKESDVEPVGAGHSTSPQFPSAVQGNWLQYQQPQFQHGQQSMMGFPMGQPVAMGGGPVMEIPYAENQISLQTPLMGTLSDKQGSSRKRITPEDVPDRSVERRQKRMIKNRESAARSRARKQAYTNELENKVMQLEEENDRLRKWKEVEKLLPSVPPPEPRYQLRRTSSSPL